ncbi:choice-of-anchor V domain-containing protein [Hyphococcus formosus]|uniref:choice-of-anchor V domain-containing protein n=1 Tax=Hyphococcus formosus TaxID=3143534 RepID=UPI00398B7A4D
MILHRVVGAALASMFITGAALANPDGAPWGASNPQSVQNCHSCHFDGKANLNSSAITLEGVPKAIKAGETYRLTLNLAKPEKTVAGFLASVSRGKFSAQAGDLEVMKGQIRSTEPKLEIAKWVFDWTAPEEIDGEVVFMIAANAANDDQSSFGDEIHFRTFTVK